LFTGVAAVRRQRVQQALTALPGPCTFHAPRHTGAQLFTGTGLDKIIAGAELQSLNRSFKTGVTGHHDDNGIAGMLSNAAQQLSAA